MNSLDILYIGIMVLTLLISSYRGGIREASSIVAVAVGFIAASRLYSVVSGQMLSLTSHEAVNNVVAFLLIFFFFAMLISYAGGQLTQLAVKAKLGLLNSLAGTVVGALKGLLVCALLTYMLLVFMPPRSGLFAGSKAFPIMSELTVAVSPIGPKHFRVELDRKLDDLFGRAAAAAAKKAVKPEGQAPAPAQKEAVTAEQGAAK